VQEETKGSQSIVDLGIGVFLLAVVGLLAANVFIIQSAISYNDESCKLITIAAARAAEEGQDQKGIMLAAQRELFSCGTGGFFISAPQLKYFTHDKVGGKHRFKVATQTVAHVPVPVLVLENNRMPSFIFKRIYVLETGEQSESSNQSLPTR
jgi:hypothetical protein